MIEAARFVDSARRHGFDFYAGVPCSFLTSFINHVIDDDTLDYISSSNEGDAVATAAGAWLGGRRSVAMMQNSGLGNAVNPITSLACAFEIPILLIVTLRGDPELADEPQHTTMGAITPALLEQMGVQWAWFPTEADAVDPLLERIDKHMRETRLPFALIMRKGSIIAHDSAPRRITGRPAPSAAIRSYWSGQGTAHRPARYTALQQIVMHTPVEQTVVFATTGYTGRELAALDDRPNQLYMVGSMGCAASLGLGLALVRPDLQVIVIDGDGAALMRLGNFATLGAYAGSNLLHIVLDNEAHDSTGTQATVSAGVSFAGIARACGYQTLFEGDELQLLPELFATVTGPAALPEQVSGPALAHLKIQTGTRDNLPRPALSPVQVAQRLRAQLQASAPAR